MNVTGLVLAAGFGTRLKPSTQYCPKPLIPVGGVEPLFHALYQMHELGLQDVIVNAHYLHEQISAALRSWQAFFPKMKLHLSLEMPHILGTGASIQKVLCDFPQLFEQKGLLVMNGDTLAAFDVRPLVSKLEESCFAVSYWNEHLKKYKPLWVDREGRWAGIGANAPKPGTKAAHFLGIHYLSPQHLRVLSQTLPKEIVEVDLFNGIYRPLVDKGYELQQRVIMGDSVESPYSSGLFWFDMTNIEFLLEAQRFVMSHLTQNSWWPRLLKARYPNIEEISPGVWVSAKERGACRFSGPAIYVENAGLSSSRSLGRVDLGPDASIIFEGERLNFASSSQDPLVIKNSVVLVSRTDSGEALPKLIENDVRII
jgi:NDP-sugar pyrophosphorylase family protein